MSQPRDCESCPQCHQRGRVTESKKRKGGYRRRIHRCGKCKLTWISYQSTIDPRLVKPLHVPI